MKKIIWFVICVLVLSMLIIIDIYYQFSLISNMQQNGQHIYTKKSEIQKIINENEVLLGEILGLFEKNPFVSTVQVNNLEEIIITCRGQEPEIIRPNCEYSENAKKFINMGGIVIVRQVWLKTNFQQFINDKNAITIMQINTYDGNGIGVIYRRNINDTNSKWSFSYSKGLNKDLIYNGHKIRWYHLYNFLYK